MPRAHRPLCLAFHNASVTHTVQTTASLKAILTEEDATKAAKEQPITVGGGEADKGLAVFDNKDNRFQFRMKTAELELKYAAASGWNPLTATTPTGSVALKFDFTVRVPSLFADKDFQDVPFRLEGTYTAPLDVTLSGYSARARARTLP